MKSFKADFGEGTQRCGSTLKIITNQLSIKKLPPSSLWLLSKDNNKGEDS